MQYSINNQHDDRWSGSWCCYSEEWSPQGHGSYSSWWWFLPRLQQPQLHRKWVTRNTPLCRQMTFIASSSRYRDKQEGPEYNNKFNSNGRTRIILPGEDPNDPNRVLIPGLHDANNNNRMYPNNRYPSPGPYGPAQYDPRCAFRFGHPMNHSYSSGSCTLCSTAR